jgi:hypothetical protein
LAYKDDINSTSNTLTLTTTEKLDKYIKASSYKLRTEAVIKETLPTDITVKADMKFRVTADPFSLKRQLLFFNKCKFRFNTGVKIIPKVRQQHISFVIINISACVSSQRPRFSACNSK